MVDTLSENKTAKWKKIVFPISIGLNVLILAGALGLAAQIKGNTGADRSRAQTHGLYGAMVRALPEEDRKALRGQYIELRKKGGDGQRETRRENEAQLRALIAAEPFDKDAFAEHLENMRKSQLGSAGKSDVLWADLIANMSPEERESFVANLDFKKRKRKK